MIIDIIMPKMGESITEGTILEWRKGVGDRIELDEILLEIGTDKVDSDIPSSAAGVISEILAEPNDVIDVGKVIAKIETEDSIAVENPIKEVEEQKQVPELLKKIPEERFSENPPVLKASQAKKKTFFTPIVKKIASEKDMSLEELESIPGTGRNGRVTKKDILKYTGPSEKDQKPIDQSLNTPPAIPSGRTVEMQHMRKVIAKHMKESIETSAHVYVMTEVDMTSIVDHIKSHNKSFMDNEGFNLTFTPFIVDSVVRALQEHPDMNASLSGTSIKYHKNINIGLAVAVESGLMVPTIINCEEKNFLGLCRSVNDVATRTRTNSISPDELSGSTFSITNFGIFGVSMGTPIINQPNVGILGVGAIKKQPVVIESIDGDAIAIRNIMILSLGFDHRLIDGAGGAKFLEKIRNNLETIDLNTI
jgi:2-oxoglutarate dehydrogenase E2 component (dihydrolipoamide succinyltransferase)